MAGGVSDLGGRTGGTISDSRHLGALGTRLRILKQAGLPISDGFVLEPSLVRKFANKTASGRKAAEEKVVCALARLERRTGRRFGGGRTPLLLAARTSPAGSRLGLYPSVLGFGLTQKALDSLANRYGRSAAAEICDGFVQSYAAAAPCGSESCSGDFDRAEKSAEDERNSLIEASPRTQLMLALRHLARPRMPGVRSTEEGHAILIQEMAQALAGGRSGTGVMRLRSLTDGSLEESAAFLKGARGDHPQARTHPTPAIARNLARRYPALWKQLREAAQAAEACLGEALGIGFVIEEDTLRIVDVNPLHLEGRAEVAVALDFVEQGILTREAAVLRLDPLHLEGMLHAQIDPDAAGDGICRGIAASPGAASGTLAFSAGEVERVAAQGGAPVLARVETNPADVGAMHAAVGVLTLRGGATSHAAVVARGLGRPCVTGIGDADIAAGGRGLRVADGRLFKEGDAVTVDGSAGIVHAGVVPTRPPDFGRPVEVLLEWADEIRRMSVRANADTAKDAEQALAYRAEGVGLCRTEHMFFARGRINAMREMILAESEEERRRALEVLQPMQHRDFCELFVAMRGRPVVVRLLDPPLHEFLPRGEREMLELAESMNMPVDRVMVRAASLAEFNPMLGNRGCRLGIAYPEIYEMQTRAIIEATIDAGWQTGEPPIPEIMIPLVSTKREIEILKRRIDAVAAEVVAESGSEIAYRVGAMIETPRAALRAGAIAESADFLSFGTNDLTQMTFGMSRDDAGRFMPDYLRQGVFEIDPFDTIDAEGVGELIGLATARARARCADIGLGLCGEHGADPASVEFCERLGFDYVSCSPLRLPVARLAAAQATIRAARKGGKGKRPCR